MITNLSRQQQTNSCLNDLVWHRDDLSHRRKGVDYHKFPKEDKEVLGGMYFDENTKNSMTLMWMVHAAFWSGVKHANKTKEHFGPRARVKDLDQKESAKDSYATI